MSLILIALIFSFYLNYLASKNCKKNAELYLENPYNPVYDIIQYHAPIINLHTPDYLILLTAITAYIRYLFLLLLTSNDIYTIFIIKFNKHIINLVYSFLLRGITTRLTIIPTCMPKPTVPKKNLSNYYYYNNVSLMIGYTHDLMYSGHTIVFIFLGKMIEDDYYSNIFLYISGNIIQYIFPISLILSRQHYTIDVFIAMITYNFFNFGLN